MALLYPFSQRTLNRLQEGPTPGTTHKWLSQIAGGLRHILQPERCFTFLRRACDERVTHREVPDSEIEDAVDFAYGGESGLDLSRQAFAWPDPDSSLIARVLSSTAPAFDVTADLGLSGANVLPALFQPDELVCVGRDNRRAVVRPLEAALGDTHLQQFIVLNPMRGLQAVNFRKRPSTRCQNNILKRRFLVAESDDRSLSKAQQAQILTWLSRFVPLVMVVDSGGKSLHGWFRVEHLCPRDQGRFFAVACLAGADESRWDSSGWLRMPGGTRVDKNGSHPQRILYFKPYGNTR
jgi:hypothetical protein